MGNLKRAKSFEFSHEKTRTGSFKNVNTTHTLSEQNQSSYFDNLVPKLTHPTRDTFVLRTGKGFAVHYWLVSYQNMHHISNNNIKNKSTC